MTNRNLTNQTVVFTLILNEYIKRYRRANAKEASGEQSNQRTMGHPHSETLEIYKAESNPTVQSRL